MGKEDQAETPKKSIIGYQTCCKSTSPKRGVEIYGGWGERTYKVDLLVVILITIDTLLIILEYIIKIIRNVYIEMLIALINLTL